LLDFFGAVKPLREITQGDAEDFARHLFSKGKIIGDKRGPLAENTVRKRYSIAKQSSAML
jgi:hypothetical protein